MPALLADSKRLIPFLAILAFFFAGCAGPLEVKYEPKTSGQFKASVPSTVFVAPFKDLRDLSRSPNKDPMVIGNIESTVSDMTGSRLTLSEDVTETVARAYRKELAIAGFTVVPEKEKARHIVSGEVREFSLNIGSRDEIAIEISTEVKDAQTGEIVWSGLEAERADRFAGVMGNSRATISNYIAASLQKVIRRSIASAGERLSGGVNKPVHSVEEAETPSAGGKGKIVVAASPERSKVYIDGVYYGLTPITIDMPPGVYEVTIRQQGFKTLTDKVSIRKDATTEMEAELERE